MSDQYTPPKQPPYTRGTYVPGAPNGTEVPPSVAPIETGLFGTGMLVALAFVVVAILAAAVFSYNRSAGVPAGTAPGVTIQNNTTAPAASGTTPSAAKTPDVAAPAITAPDATAPATTTPDTAAPAPSTTAPAKPAPSATSPDTTKPAVPAPTTTAPAAPVSP